MPKTKSAVWVKFECVNKANNTGKWAKCKKCKIEMQGIPSRMEKHLLTSCNETDEEAVLKQSTTNSQASTSKQGTHLLITEIEI